MHHGKRILANFQASRGNNDALGVRICDFQLLGKNSVLLMVASPRELNQRALSSFVLEATNRSVSALMDTAKHGVHPSSPNTQYYTVVAARNPKMSVPENDVTRSKMVALTANTYLDQELQTVWRKEEVSGAPMFTRENDDDLSEVIRHASYMTSSASAAANDQVTLDTVAPYVAPGDLAEVFVMDDEGNTGRTIARVIKASDTKEDNYIMEVGTDMPGVVAEIPVHAVLQVHKLSAGKNSEILDYLREAYGPEYAQYISKMGTL